MIGGRVKAAAIVIRSLKNNRKSAGTGKALGAEAPKCWMYILSLRIPQVVLTVKVMSRFWMEIGTTFWKAT